MPSWVSITKPTQGDATKKSFADNVIDDLDYLYDALGTGSGVINGSFETGSGTGEPAGWTRSSNPGTSGITSTTADVAHGAQAWYATSTGAGGCVLISADYIECSEYVPVILSWLMKGTAAVKNTITLKFYTDEQSSVSDTVIYTDDTTNPTSYTRFIRGCTPPATARYMKIELTLCDASDATPGSTYIDGIELLGSTTEIIAGNAAAGGYAYALVDLAKDGVSAVNFTPTGEGDSAGVSYTWADVAGGATVAIQVRKSGPTVEGSVSLALPAGIWSIHANAMAFQGGSGSPTSGNYSLSAVAIRQNHT